MAERDFDADRKKKTGHSFTLGGQKFHTYPGMSVTFINKAVEGVDDDDVKPLERTIKFLRSLIVKEDRERFDALIEDEEVYIEANDLLDLSNWLIEVISKRPTKRPGSSGNGGKPTSSQSKGSSSATPGSDSKTLQQKKPSPSAT